MFSVRIISLLVPTGSSAGRFRSVSGLGAIIFGMLAALLPQANVMGQFGFNVPYSDHDLNNPGTIDTFELHSNPGASKVIYMDFDGHIAPEWDNYVYDAYNFEGNDNSFSDAEQREIRLAWQSVAEDFLPFDVDVTTEDPGITALRKKNEPGSNPDTEWGIRAVISDSEGAGEGGWAYVGSFNANYDRMLYAAAEDVDLGDGVNGTDWLEVADMVSHEVGHSVGLNHDGPGYWTGHGTDGTATYYAPIMGWTWYGPSTWDQGVYDGADNQQNDLNVITTTNGFGYRTDDHGDTTGSATAITDGELTEGIIGRHNNTVDDNDLDYFSFSMASAGQVTFDINPNKVGRDHWYGTGTPTGTVGANLDILAEIRDSNGDVIHTSNPIETLDASFDVNLPAGDYYLSIDGTGKGDPATNGYSEYGSLGYFSIMGSGWDDPGPPDLPGDFDLNGEVNGLDFLLWQQDPNVGLLANWEANYGNVATLSATSAAVPEPTTCTLALAALCLAMSRRRILAR
jgi:serralysin